MRWDGFGHIKSGHQVVLCQNCRVSPGSGAGTILICLKLGNTWFILTALLLINFVTMLKVSTLKGICYISKNFLLFLSNI